MLRDYNAPGFFFGEADFEKRMKEEAAPILDQVQSGDFKGTDGNKIHYEYLINEDEKAAIVISHGFCEFFPKYHEMFYIFYAAGYSVFFIEHRGHGYSYRECAEHDKVHVTDFFRYVEDLKLFMDGVVQKESKTKKVFLYSHSMGGCIGACYMEKYPTDFACGVLSSPMMQLNFRGINPILVALLTTWSAIAGWDEKYLPSQHGFDGINTYPNCSALSEARHRYLFEIKKQVRQYQTNGGTYKWCRESMKGMRYAIKNAAKITAPAILFQAGLDTMVEPGGQEKFLKNNPRIKKYEFPASKHEIFNANDEDRIDYYRKVLDFYAQN